MRTLDDTDREILRLLLADGRRPFSEIADRVGLSAPAVSDRIDRLREIGVIEGFTVRIDGGTLSTGVDALVSVSVPPADAADAYESLTDHDRVEHAFLAADGEVTVGARVDPDEVRSLVDEAVGLDRVRDLSVRVIDRRDWSPAVGEADLAVDCAECDNTVTAEGESARIDGELYHFCCASCRDNFVERYERLEKGA